MEYLLHGIPWATVQRMVVDAATVESKDAENPEPVAITTDNAQDILNAINALQR